MRHLRIAVAAAVIAGVAAIPVFGALSEEPSNDDSVAISKAVLATSIAYQGRLVDAGAPANGVYDLRFIAFDSEIGGTQFGQVVTREDVTVTNGLFTTQLDFGADVFKGDQRWVELAVKPGSGGNFTVLSPRQPVSPVPYALYAKEAGVALPFGATGASASITGLFSITQSDAGVAIAGRRTYAGSVDSPAVLGANSGTGAGVQGESTFASGIGVLGSSTGATGIGGRFSGKTGVQASGAGEGAVALDLQNGAIKVSGATKPAFVHRASLANSSANYTVIDHPLTNGDPNALLFITQVLNPGGGAGFSFMPALGVQYLGATAPEPFRNKWAIFTEDGTTPIPTNVAFNVLVVKQ